MAKLLVRLRLNAGNPSSLRRALDSDPNWAEAESRGMRFRQVYVNPKNASEATIISGWKSSEDAQSFSQQMSRQLVGDDVDAEIVGDADVVVAAGGDQ